MKLRIALLPFAFIALAACKAPQPPAPPQAPTAPTAPGAPQTALGRAAEKAINEARKELKSKNITIGDDYAFGNFKVGSQHDHGGPAKPKAEISPAGDFIVEGKTVAITPEQRALLLQYRGHIEAMAEAGMSMGVQGADLAGKAMKEAIIGVMNGKGDQIEQKMEAEGEKLRVQAKQLCAQMSPMLKTQAELAASLPEFKPYATLTQEDIDDCTKDVEQGKTASNSDPATRDKARDEVRQKVREAIRGGVQEATGTQNSKP